MAKTKSEQPKVIKVTGKQLLKVLKYNMARAGYRFSKVNALVFLERVGDRIPAGLMASYTLAVKQMPN